MLTTSLSSLKPSKISTGFTVVLVMEAEVVLEAVMSVIVMLEAVLFDGTVVE